MRGAEDIDMSLTAMLHDRVLVMDRRWRLDFGVIFGEVGGCQVDRTLATHQKDSDMMKAKWKGHVHFGSRNTKFRAKKSRSFVGNFTVKVNRSSPLGYKGG